MKTATLWSGPFSVSGVWQESGGFHEVFEKGDITAPKLPRKTNAEISVFDPASQEQTHEKVRVISIYRRDNGWAYRIYPMR
jgi:hypothetical protein